MSPHRTLLLTDVVDSTQLSQALGDVAMAGVWTAHDRVARDLLPHWRGREIDKTDGMLLLFDVPDDAVNYALAYHRALAALPVPLRARTGLHVGPVILRENNAADVARGAKPLEVDGLAKPTTARVMAIAQGGQLLLTAEAHQALGDTRLQAQSHGHWVMKGLSEPVELFEVGEPDAPFIAPTEGDKAYRVVRNGDRWLPVRQIPNNLPQPITSFIGRERELDEVKSLLSSTRLLTLVGMGGLGKTRLSLQVAAEVMYEYPDGVWFLDLAPIRDPALVVSEAAQTLGVREAPDRPLIQALCAHLKTRRVMLILDNCEHLLEATAILAHAILRAAPQARLMASSREALHVPGEQAYAVLPLPLPGRDDSLEALSRSTAVRLFVDRARLHKLTFMLTEREAPAVAELVARLEGIPLALELAAARVRTLTVGAINARLKDRYKLLTGGGRVLLQRQQTLRALVDWSYDLLNETEQTVFNRLSVFVGGFDLAAAEKVCGAEPLCEDDVRDLLASLTDKSLVMLEELDQGMRYRMLETIHEYAREKLESADEAASTAVRHCEHYFVVAKAVRDGLEGPQQAEWTGRAETDLDNLRAAIALPLAGGTDAVIAAKFAGAMWGFWMLRGYSSEGRGIVREVLALPAIRASDLAHAHMLYVGAALATSQSDHAEARQLLETCLALRRRLGHPAEIAATLSTLSWARLQAGDAEGAGTCEREALELFRSLDDTYGQAIGLLHLGQIAVYLADESQAQANLLDSLRIAKAIQYMEIEGEAELMLGECDFHFGRIESARQRFDRSLAVCREAGDKRGEAHALWWLGKADLEGGELVAARSRLGDSLQTFRDFEMREELVECLEDHAVLAALQEEPEVGVRLAATAQAYRSRLDLVRSPHGERQWHTRLEILRTGLTVERFTEGWNVGSEDELETAIRAARTLSVPGTVN